MKKFATTLSNGHTIESSLSYEANTFVNYDDKQKFFIKGNEVSATEFFATVASDLQKKYENKNSTHKQVRVLYGSSVACYVTKWVKR